MRDTVGHLRLVRRFWDHGITHYNPAIHTLDNGRVWLLPDLGMWYLGFDVAFPTAIWKGDA